MVETKSFPSLETERLVLRAFTLDDAADVQRLAGDRDIAKMVMSIPHPYEDGVAEEWIATHQTSFERGESVLLAITVRAGGALIGSIGLDLYPDHQLGQLGYWIGKPYWNNGYCTEAARAVVHYGFESWWLHRIFATHFKRNPASGRVMQKLGMQHEGCLREHVKRWNRFEDCEYYGILRSEYEQT
jgi:RimJ/RimL family protein N-acetyltransferase